MVIPNFSSMREIAQPGVQITQVIFSSLIKALKDNRKYQKKSKTVKNLKIKNMAQDSGVQPLVLQGLFAQSH